MSSNEKKLQNFEHGQAEYNRPNQKWQCGHLCDGQSCYMGPSSGGGCQSSCECLPKKVGDRWYCTRAASKGGECAKGPGTDGSCACQLPPCQPRLSLRHQRGRLVIMACLACLGVLLFYLGGDQEKREQFISPGELSSVHGSEGMSCAQCHVGGEELGAFTPAGAFSSSCLACHKDQIGDWVGRGQMAHGMGEVELKQRTASAQKNTSGPLLSLASTIFSKHHLEGRPLECNLCHKEHQGRSNDLAVMTDRQCQVCHKNQFKSFSEGHPSFDQKKYPYSRRTRIVFDHQSHFTKHFKKESQDAPKGYDKMNPMDNAATCVACHQPDARGEKMRVASFDISCAKCHNRSVTGEGGSPLALFSLPDLGERAPHPRWPNKAGLDLTPATRLLLDPAIQKSLAALPRDPESGNITLSQSIQPELAKEISTELSKAYEAIWNEGHSAVTTRLQANGFGSQTGDSEGALSKSLVSGLSLDTLRAQLFPGVRWGLGEFAFPELDINTLNARLLKSSNRSVGLWPSSTTGPLSALMFQLLSQDPVLKKDLATLKPLEKDGNILLSDLSKASPQQIKAVENVVWGIKRIYQSVQFMGDPVIERFVYLYGGIFDRDTGGLRKQIFRATHSDAVFSAGWKNELTLFRSGQWPPPSAPPKVIAPIEPDGADDDFGEDEEESADDDFGEDNEDEPASEKESSDDQPATDFDDPTSPLDWMKAGGWFHEKSQINYTSRGHADPVLKAWLDVTIQALNSPNQETRKIGSDLLFQSLDYRNGVKSSTSGKCLKCHTVDRVPSTGLTKGHWRINWYSRGKEPSGRTRLTRFRHDKHLAQMSCLNCHQFNKSEEYLSAFPTKLASETQGEETLEQLWKQISGVQLKKCNPGNFTSNFKPLNHQNDCARCHQPEQAGNSCTQCHSYHAMKH